MSRQSFVDAAFSAEPEPAFKSTSFSGYEDGEGPQLIDPLSKQEELNHKHLDSLDVLHDLYGKDLQKVIMMSMGRNDETLGPHVQVVNVGAPVHSSVSMRSNTNGVTTITRIRNPNLSDEFVQKEIQPRIARCIAAMREQREKNPALVASLDRHYSPERGVADAARWVPDLSNGAVMVRSSLVPNENGVGEHKVYHIVITSHSGRTLTKQLASIMNQEGMTALEVHNHPAFKWASMQSDRNANRILQSVKGAIDEALAAQGKDAGTSNIRSQFDTLAFVPKHHVPEAEAIPDSTLRFNRSNALYKQGETKPYGVAFYHNCADGKQSQYTTLISGDYIHPMYEFHGAPHRTESGKVLGHPGFITNEQNANAIPIFFNFNTQDVRTQTARAITPDVQSDLNRQIAKANINQDISVSALHGAFRQPTNDELEFLKTNASAYGLDPHNPYTTYHPVATIV